MKPLTPLQSASLIVGFGLLVQGYSVWKLRRALNWRKLLPFVVGAAFGVPAGVALLTWSDPRSIRIAVGVFLVLYSVYAFFRPALKPVTVGGIGADAAGIGADSWASGRTSGTRAGTASVRPSPETAGSAVWGLPKSSDHLTAAPMASASNATALIPIAR